LRWSGETTLNSLQGKGELVFEKVALSELAKYLKPLTNISVASGQMDLRLPYTFSYAAGKFDLGLTDAQIKVGDLSVLIPQADGAESLKLDLLSGVLDLAELRNDQARPIPFNASLVLKDGGELQTQGQFTPTTKLLAADLTFKSVALKSLQPFLAPYTPLQIASGTVSGQGRISPGIGRSTGLRYVGSVKVAGVELKEPDGDVFAQWKDASAEKIILGLDPISVRIPELIWVEPSAKFAIEVDRSFSAAGLMIQTKGIDSEKVSNPSPVVFNVQRLRIQQGQLDFTDRSLNPQFKTKLIALNGVINSLSNKKDTRSQIALDGRVNEFGLARIRGDMDLFNLGNNTQINAQLKNLDLPSATPYAIKFAGYAITDGKMTLDLQYKVRANQVEGNNKITIDALTLGQRVDSLTALKIPLELAIALLKDDAGRIELGLPVTGNMNDPQFSFDSLIWKALGNALTKIVSAPFRAIANLFGKGSDANTLDAIGFDAGSETLLAPEQEKLQQIARMLSQRQQLKISIPEHYDPALDSPVLTTQALRKEIYKRAGIQFDIDEPLAPLNFSSRAIRKAMREMYAQRLGAAALQERIKAAEDKSLLQRLGQLIQSEPQFADPAAFYQGLYLRLQETQTLAADALSQLGVQRALAVSKGLSKAGVSLDRIALTNPGPGEKNVTMDGQVHLQLGLGLVGR
jgi:outer membrane protein OmpA-like peptidoglycan-associated protein